MNLAPRPVHPTFGLPIACAARDGSAMAGPTDFDRLATLARQAQQGDAAACEALLQQLYDYVLRVLAARLGRIADLDDLTQECLLGMHRSLPTYHPSRNIRPWIHAIIRYKIADHFRARARRRESPLHDEIVAPLAQAEASGHESNGVISRIDLRAIVNSLPEPLSRAVILTKFEGYSTTEAARREGIAETALRKRLSRAYGELAQRIEQQMEAEDHGS